MSNPTVFASTTRSAASTRPQYTVMDEKGELARFARKDRASKLADEVGGYVLSPKGDKVYMAPTYRGDVDAALADPQQTEFVQDGEGTVAVLAPQAPQEEEVTTVVEQAPATARGRKPKTAAPTVAVQPSARFKKDTYGEAAATGYAKLPTSTLRAQIGVSWGTLNELGWNKQDVARAVLAQMGTEGTDAVLAARRAELGLGDPDTVTEEPASA
jgi:hypothetical protein